MADHPVFPLLSSSFFSFEFSAPLTISSPPHQVDLGLVVATHIQPATPIIMCSGLRRLKKVLYPLLFSSSPPLLLPHSPPLLLLLFPLLLSSSSPSPLSLLVSSSSSLHHILSSPSSPLLPFFLSSSSSPHTILLLPCSSPPPPLPLLTPAPGGGPHRHQLPRLDSMGITVYSLGCPNFASRI